MTPLAYIGLNGMAGLVVVQQHLWLKQYTCTEYALTNPA
jgi:hypothetical protein